MKLIYPNNEMFDYSTFFYAAKYDYLNIIKWLRSIGIKWDEYVMRGAAIGGQTEIIRYLKSEGAPMDNVACECAAEEGHLEALQALREGPIRCPWDIRAFEWAVRKNHLDIARWLFENNAPMNTDDLKEYTRKCIEENRTLQRTLRQYEDV